MLVDSLDQYRRPPAGAPGPGQDGSAPPADLPPILLGGGPRERAGRLLIAPLTRLCVARWCSPAALEAGAILSGLVGLIAAEVEAGDSLAAADAWVRARLAAQAAVPLTAHPAATSFVAFLVRTLGADTLRQFLVAYDPARRDQGARRAYGRPLHMLEAAWLATLRRPPQAALRVFFRQIRPLVHPSARTACEIGICILIGLGVILLLPLASQYILDTILPAHNLTLLGLCSAGLFLAYVVSTLADQRRMYLGANLTQDTLIELQEHLFAHLQRLSPAFYTQAHTGDLAARFTSDSTLVERAVDGVINSGIPMALTAVAVAGLLSLLNGFLAALLLILVPPFALSYHWLRGQLDQALYTQQHLAGHLLAGLQESLAGQAIIRAFRMQERTYRTYRIQVAHIDRIDTRVRILAGRFGTSTGVALAAGQILVLGVGGILVVQNQLTVGTLVAFLGLVTTLFSPIAALSDVGRLIQNAAGALDRITELLHQEVTVVDDPAAIPLPPLTTAIQFENLSFGYTPGSPILQEVDLTIPTRSQVAVVGPSGAGKSTLAYLLLRFWDPAAGRILFDGQDIRRTTQASLHSQIGVVFQDTFLFNTTIRENIALGRPDVTDAAVAAAARVAQLDDFIGSLPLGYDTVVGERGVRMSGGQRQRLAIARALVGDPPVLIFDEATSALDAQTERELQEVLARVSHGRTTILITHRLAQAAAADQIVVLDQGRVVEQGRHGDLMRQAGLYRRLFEEQAGYVGADGQLRLRTAAARLRAIPLFADLTGAALNTLAEELEWEAFAADVEVVRQGEPGDTLYLIQRGAAAVLIRDHQAEREIARLADGDYFGEGSLLAGGMRTATVRTTEPTEFYTLTRAHFTDLLARAPAIQAAVEAILQTRRANRLR
ncbi:MAG TPA: ATP-binding cassette domain-containing protein, partial [Chloroflexia bacterium]|nr:ATP-binding cassette domain-containing protein [Chloroflexia bacterium]